MWNLSDESMEAIRQLYELERPPFWSGRAKQDEGICALLDDLAKKGEPGALPEVARFLVASNEWVRRSARHVVTSVLSSLSPYDLIQLDDVSGWSYSWQAADAWDEIKPSDVADVAGEAHDPSHLSVLGLLSFHRNGFVRQEAVRRLSEVWDGSELPFLLIRQNDWVLPIAKDAQAAVKNRIDDTYLPHLVRSLRLILHLNTFSRYDHLHLLSGDEILAVALEADGLFTRKNAVALLAELGKWRSIPWLLRAATTAENETSPFAEQMIERLSNKQVFTKPTKQQAQQIEAALSEARGRASPKIIAIAEGELVRFS